MLKIKSKDEIITQGVFFDKFSSLPPVAISFFSQVHSYTLSPAAFGLSWYQNYNWFPTGMGVNKSAVNF